MKKDPISEIDISAIDYNLSLSPTQRLEQHQAALETVNELKKAHVKVYAKPESVTKNTSRIRD